MILLLSFILHMILMGLILTLLFYFVINLATFRTISKLLVTQLVAFFKLIPTDAIDKINQYSVSQNVPPEKLLYLLDNMKYQRDETRGNNRKLYAIVAGIISLMVISFILIVIKTKSYLSPEFYVMLTETLGTFILVGILEAMFFLQIARNYVVMMPSEIESVAGIAIATAFADYTTPQSNIYPPIPIPIPIS